MEAEEDKDSMEIENTPQLGQVSEAYGGMRGAAEGRPQWHQQHCMVPLPPHNTSTPITWFQWPQTSLASGIEFDINSPIFVTM